MFGVGKFRILDWMGSESGPLPRRHCGKGQRRSRALSIDPFLVLTTAGRVSGTAYEVVSGLAGEIPDVRKLFQPGPAARRGRADPAPRAAAASARPASRCESRLCSLQREILADAARRQVGCYVAHGPARVYANRNQGGSGIRPARRRRSQRSYSVLVIASSRSSCRCSPIPMGKCCSGVLGWRGGLLASSGTQ
jgi:hypothetical protein